MKPVLLILLFTKLFQSNNDKILPKRRFIYGAGFDLRMPFLSQTLSSMKRSLFFYLRRLRQWLVPPGGKREKGMQMGFRGLRIWKNEGLITVCRIASKKISAWFSFRNPHPDLIAKPSDSEKKGSAGIPLDLQAVPNGLPIPSSYDVILLTMSKWNLGFERQQQIAKRFAQDGYRVFYASTGFKKGAKSKISPIEERIFEVQFPGSGSINVHFDILSKEMMDTFLGTFDSLHNEFGIVDAVCIVDLPFWKSTAFSLRERFGWRLIYDYMKDSNRPDNTSDKIIKEHESLVRNSDLVLVSLQSLFNEIEMHNPNCLLVPDTIDGVDHFSVPTNISGDVIKQQDYELARMDITTQNTPEDGYALVIDNIPALFPQASIIIVTYNNLEYTRLCLKSIFEKTIYPNFEVIIVDNASTDGTLEFVKSFETEHENIRVISNPENEGFARANNLGIAEARGDYIVLLNNDTVVTRVWLSRLIRHLGDQSVGLVGSVTNGVANEAYVEMQFTDLAGLDAFATKLAKEKANRLTPIKMLAMYCIAGRREVFRQIGPLDEQFGIGMFEDDDYSLRARKAGYKIAVAEDVFIHHFGRSGFKLLGDERYLALFEENRSKFEAKWNIKWEQHESGTLVQNRRYTSDLLNILNAHPDVPGVIVFPPTIGWNITLFQRPHQIAKAFAKMGYLVFFCTEAQVDNIQGFKQVSQGLYLANIPWPVFDLLDRPVIFTLPYNREYIFQLRQPHTVYEVIDDLDVFPGDKTQLKKNHDSLLKEADVVVVTADRLMEQVKQARPDAILCPNAVELDHFSQVGESDPKTLPPDLELILERDRPVIGYYGALARWFDYDLVRQAAQKRSDWDFLLIGPDHDHSLAASNLLSIPNVHWLGARDYAQLPRYLRYFDVATIPFMVNDITIATSPIKLFEYMAARKPIVTSDLPECRKYPGVLVALSAKEYVDQLEVALTLVHDSVYLQQLYRTAQENTWEARVKEIIDALEHLRIPARNNS